MAYFSQPGTTVTGFRTGRSFDQGKIADFSGYGPGVARMVMDRTPAVIAPTAGTLLGWNLNKTLTRLYHSAIVSIPAGGLPNFIRWMAQSPLTPNSWKPGFTRAMRPSPISGGGSGAAVPITGQIWPRRGG